MAQVHAPTNTGNMSTGGPHCVAAAANAEDAEPQGPGLLRPLGPAASGDPPQTYLETPIARGSRESRYLLVSDSGPKSTLLDHWIWSLSPIIPCNITVSGHSAIRGLTEESSECSLEKGSQQIPRKPAVWLKSTFCFGRTQAARKPGQVDGQRELAAFEVSRRSFL